VELKAISRSSASLEGLTMEGNTTTIGQALEPVMPILYLVALGMVLSIIFSIVEMFSVDRVLKLVRGRRVFVFLGKEAHYGRLETPPRSKGGFEVFYADSGIENPKSLIGFLLENYQETGNERFLEKAKVLLDYLKERGLIDRDATLDDIRVDSWAPPSMVSRKVYSNELGDLWMIISFVDAMSEEEKLRRWKELSDLYGKPLLKRTKRRVYNALSYVKDKVASSITSSTSVLMSSLPADLRKAVEEAETKALGAAVAQSYDPLLENSIGRLVTVRVDDIDGERKLYQGVLGEYSDKYVYVLDVDYRLQMTAKVKGQTIVSVEPVVRFFGEKLELGEHLAVSRDGVLEIKNAWERPVKVEKITFDGGEVSLGKVLHPGESVTVETEVPPEFSIHYEISLESDVVWPRSKAVIVGLGDYPPRILEAVIGGLRVKDLVKKLV